MEKIEVDHECQATSAMHSISYDMLQGVPTGAT